MNEDTRPTHLDLCSGSGSFSLAFERQGFRTIGFAEIDPYCSALLRKHWPEVVNYGCLGNVPRVACDVISAGWPCQPVSTAGHQRGERDDRWIWPAVLATVERCQPNFFLGENVIGIKGMVLSRCLDGLAERGYQSKAFDIPSCGVGLPSVERHVWIIASRNKIGLERGKEAQLSNFGKKGTIQLNGRKIQPATSGEGIGWYFSPSRNLRTRKGFAYYMDRISAIGNAAPPQIAQVFARAIYQTLTAQ